MVFKSIQIADVSNNTSVFVSPFFLTHRTNDSQAEKINNKFQLQRCNLTVPKVIPGSGSKKKLQFS